MVKVKRDELKEYLKTHTKEQAAAKWKTTLAHINLSFGGRPKKAVRNPVSASGVVVPKTDAQALPKEISQSQTVGTSTIADAPITVSAAPENPEARQIQMGFAEPQESGAETETGAGAPEPTGPQKRRVDLADIASVASGIVSVNLTKRGYSPFTVDEINRISEKARGLSELTPNVDTRLAAGLEFAGAIIAPVAKRLITEHPPKKTKPSTEPPTIEESKEGLASAAEGTPAGNMAAMIKDAEKKRAALVQGGVSS